ncbi:MAG: hypothetical protein IKX00_03505 [Bacilli bacterium]|nr:hypothetical protein [Bacilli bacterium]
MNNNDYKYVLYYKDSTKKPIIINAIDLNLYNYIHSRSKSPSDIKFNPNALVYIFNATHNDNRSLLESVVERKKLKTPNVKYDADDFDHIEMIAESFNAVHYGFVKYSDTKKEDPKIERVIPIIYKSDFLNFAKILEEKNIKLNNLRDFFSPDELITKISSYICSEKSNDVFYQFVHDEMFKVVEEKYDDENRRKMKYDTYHFDQSGIDKKDLYSLLDSEIIYEKYGKGSTFFFNLLSLITLYERLHTIANDKNQKFRYEVLTYIGDDLITESMKHEVSYKSINDIRDDYESNKNQKLIAEDEILLTEIINTYNISYGTNISYQEYIDNFNNPLYEGLNEFINTSRAVYKVRTRK